MTLKNLKMFTTWRLRTNCGFYDSNCKVPLQSGQYRFFIHINILRGVDRRRYAICGTTQRLIE